MNRNAFQWDAYRPLVDHIPACTAWGVGGVYPSMHCMGGGWGVYPNMHWAGGVCIPACPWGCLPGGRGCLPLWTEWQTGVKTLPCRNFVAGSNNKKKYCLNTKGTWFKPLVHKKIQTNSSKMPPIQPFSNYPCIFNIRIFCSKIKILN